MAAFGALEIDASAAAKASRCAQTLSERLGTREHPLSLALHTGDAVCGDVGGAVNRTFSIVGDVVNTARRMLDIATAANGGIVVSDKSIVPGRENGTMSSMAVDLGSIKLRGRDAPVHLWRIPP